MKASMRPTGVTLIAIAFIVLGLLSFLWSLLVFGFGGASSFFQTIFNFSPTLSSGVWSGILGMATAAVEIAAGIGLLRLEKWGWYLAIIGVGLSFVQGLLGIFAGGIFTFFCGLLGLLIPGAILFYLLQGRIRDLFGVGGTSSY
ncbi:MAG: hypothetical protein ACK2UK_01545 [Candidatus Promineifilaceae bacterium]